MGRCAIEFFYLISNTEIDLELVVFSLNDRSS